MFNDYKISIVVPIYDVDQYLEKCVYSIINQSYKNIEIILVNDGSNDNSSEICDFFSKIDNRVKVIHKKNGGLVSARKAGVAIATGDYILNVDGDDWIEEDRVKVLVTEGIMPYEADMVYLAGHRKDFEGDSFLISSDIPIKTFYGDEIQMQVFPLLFDTKEIFRARVSEAIWAWGIKRELLQKMQRLIDDRIVTGEDIICCWFCLLSAESVTLVKNSSYHYVQRTSSISYRAVTAMGNNHLQMKIWYQQFKKFLDNHNILNGVYQIFIGMVIRTIMQANYELLLKQNSDYLYPFPKVRKGSKIVVYGAGKIGYSLVKNLDKIKDYSIMLWVDGNINRPALPGYKICSLQDVAYVDYDFIVVAVQNADLVNEIKNSLVAEGIPEIKIALMEASAISEEAIPSEFVL